MKSLIFLGAAALLITSAASADPIADRKSLMKERGAQMRVLGPIAQGKAPFDAAAVLDALEKLNANAQATDIEALWPAGSETGDTKSGPAIWSDREGFAAAETKLEDDLAAAVAAKPADLAAFQAVFGPVAADCGACHEKYRL
ncbi:MAG TPA: cytochrome c [Rhizobiaceae bacterium]|nr:cytochrome c [Rhizobiaceae bacterium]